MTIPLLDFCNLEVREAIDRYKYAENIFNTTTENNLIDYAIFEMRAIASHLKHLGTLRKINND